MNKETEKLKQDIEAYKQSEQEASEIIAELKAENDKLKEENKRLKELKCKFKEYYCTCNTEKYVQCLQEIKKYIAKICKEECGYVQKKRCPDCDCRYGAILDLINKAEEE